MPDAAIPALIPQRYEPAVPLDQLTPHPGNPNQADLELIGELLEANGFGGAVLAQESTGILIDGEHRLRAARDAGMKSLPVLFLDVDNEARDRLLASWNESGRRGINDERKLVSLLKGLAVTPQGLHGAAFDLDEMEAMTRRLSAGGDFDPDGEWEGMPKFDNPGKKSAYSTVVHFPSHEDAAKFFALIERPLTRTLWWPMGDGHTGFVPGADEIAES